MSGDVPSDVTQPGDALLLCELGKTEVEQFRAGLRHHHVAWLQIAMDDAAAMRGGERARNLDGVLERGVERHRAARLGERGAVEKLHDQKTDFGVVVVPGGPFAADVVERADVRMVERRDRFRLALEALPHLVARRDVGMDDLESDQPIETGVPGLVDLAHPASPEGAEDFVRSQTCAGVQDHRRPTSRIIVIKGKRRSG